MCFPAHANNPNALKIAVLAMYCLKSARVLKFRRSNPILLQLEYLSKQLRFTKKTLHTMHRATLSYVHCRRHSKILIEEDAQNCVERTLDHCKQCQWTSNLSCFGTCLDFLVYVECLSIHRWCNSGICIGLRHMSIHRSTSLLESSTWVSHNQISGPVFLDNGLLCTHNGRTQCL